MRFRLIKFEKLILFLYEYIGNMRFYLRISPAMFLTSSEKKKQAQKQHTFLLAMSIFRAENIAIIPKQFLKGLCSKILLKICSRQA